MSAIFSFRLIAISPQTISQDKDLIILLIGSQYGVNYPIGTPAGESVPLVMIANEHYYFSLCQYVVFLEVYYNLVCVHERDARASRGK